MPTVWIILIVLAVLLAAVLAVNTLRFRPHAVPSVASASIGEDNTGAEKLARVIRIPTLSNLSGQPEDRETFLRFHRELEDLFPLVHARCERWTVNDLSLVYHWPAAKPQPGRLPILLTAHMDVVPVTPGTQGDWEKDPFGGEIADGRVWGRGTLDTKIQIIAALEAAERLMAQGFEPGRDIYFAFGHDEEVGGTQGAVFIAQDLARRGLKFDFILDEGGCVVDGVLPGIRRPLATIGVGEKGYCNVKLTVESPGGHSSMPGPHSALGILAKGLCRVEARPFPMRLIPPVRAFLNRVGPYMGGSFRAILANLWLLKPVVLLAFSRANTMNAMVRTTQAVTMAQGSPAPNIMPQQATAVVNLRILPGDTAQGALEHLRRAMGRLPVTIEPIYMQNPSALSQTDTDSFALIERLIATVFGDVITAPYMVMGGTDARKYEAVCSNIYRFVPYHIDHSELAKMHGTNENITVENINRAIAFFTGLIKEC